MPGITKEEHGSITALLAWASTLYPRAGDQLRRRPKTKADLERLRRTIHDDIVRSIEKVFPADGIRTEYLVKIKAAPKRVFVCVALNGGPNYLHGSLNYVTAIGCYNASDNTPIYAGVVYPALILYTMGGKGIKLCDNRGLLPDRPVSEVDTFTVGCSVDQPLGTELGPALEIVEMMRHCDVRMSGSAIDDAVKMTQGHLDGFYGIDQSPLVAVIVAALAEAAGGRVDIDWAKLRWDEKCSFRGGTPAYMNSLCRAAPKPESLA